MIYATDQARTSWSQDHFIDLITIVYFVFSLFTESQAINSAITLTSSMIKPSSIPRFALLS